jgi:hypothetical protein
MPRASIVAAALLLDAPSAPCLKTCSRTLSVQLPFMSIRLDDMRRKSCRTAGAAVLVLQFASSSSTAAAAAVQHTLDWLADAWFETHFYRPNPGVTDDWVLWDVPKLRQQHGSCSGCCTGCSMHVQAVSQSSPGSFVLHTWFVQHIF